MIWLSLLYWISTLLTVIFEFWRQVLNPDVLRVWSPKTLAGRAPSTSRDSILDIVKGFDVFILSVPPPKLELCRDRIIYSVGDWYNGYSFSPRILLFWKSYSCFLIP